MSRMPCYSSAITGLVCLGGLVIWRAHAGPLAEQQPVASIPALDRLVYLPDDVRDGSGDRSGLARPVPVGRGVLCHLRHGPGGGLHTAGAVVPRTWRWILKGAVMVACPGAPSHSSISAGSSVAAFRPDWALLREPIGVRAPVRHGGSRRDRAGQPSSVRRVAPVRSGYLCHFRRRVPADPASRFRGLADQRRHDGQNAGAPGGRAEAGRGGDLARHHLEAGLAVLSTGCLPDGGRPARSSSSCLPGATSPALPFSWCGPR